MSGTRSRWEAWNVGAAEPIAVTDTRNLARTVILAEAGFMCQGNRWAYRSSQFTGSAMLPDVIELERREPPEGYCRFEVRRQPQ